MTFVLGRKSLAELHGVSPRLVSVVARAIQVTAVDFAVHDGLRTIEQQRDLVASGASKTLDSKHLPQPDRFGHAVDLVPFVAGRLRWEWGPTCEVFRAVAQASRELSVELRWGGCWRRVSLIVDPAKAIEDYLAFKKARGEKPFPDGAHYELMP